MAQTFIILVFDPAFVMTLGAGMQPRQLTYEEVTLYALRQQEFIVQNDIMTLNQLQQVEHAFRVLEDT